MTATLIHPVLRACCTRCDGDGCIDCGASGRRDAQIAAERAIRVQLARIMIRHDLARLNDFDHEGRWLA